MLYAYKYNTICNSVQYCTQCGTMLYLLNKRHSSCFLKGYLLLLYGVKNKFI